MTTHTNKETASWFANTMPPVRGGAIMRDGGTYALREYVMRYRIVPSVDGQGDTCEHCQEDTVQANVYVRLMSGYDEMERTCTACVLPVIDGHLDTDPSYIVTVERPQ